MADWNEQAPGFEGGQCNMVPATMISRVVEDANGIDYGLPVKQGVEDKGCAAGIAAGDFIGITVRQLDKGKFRENDEARIMTQGVIWVKAAGTVAAGDKPTYDGGWKTGGTGKPELQEARYDTGGGNGDLVQLRIWGTTVVNNA